MKRANKHLDHPEITDIKNICDISSGAKTTKDICDKVDRAKSTKKGKQKKNP